MKMISRVFRYLYYFHRAETRSLRQEALASAREYYSARPLLTRDRRPSQADYDRRSLEFQCYQRGYINQRCHDAATALLSQSTHQ